MQDLETSWVGKGKLGRTVQRCGWIWAMKGRIMARKRIFGTSYLDHSFQWM